MLADIIRKGESSNRNRIEVVGGKGHNLLRLSELSEDQDYSVPDFYIIPVNRGYSREQLNELFVLLNSPLAVRSSSPFEDSRGYSFAGRFKSLLEISNLDSFERAISEVVESARHSRVKIMHNNMDSQLMIGWRLLFKKWLIHYIQVFVIQHLIQIIQEQ